MKQESEYIIQPEEHILVVSDLIDQIVQVNKVIDLHHQHQADVLDTKQYLYIRAEKMKLLNELLGAYQLKVVHQNKAA
ncbi:MAG: hypothetical protein AAF806_23555 [Bacteroidota bacterium]